MKLLFIFSFVFILPLKLLACPAAKIPLSINKLSEKGKLSIIKTTPYSARMIDKAGDIYIIKNYGCESVTYEVSKIIFDKDNDKFNIYPPNTFSEALQFLKKYGLELAFYLNKNEQSKAIKIINNNIFKIQKNDNEWIIEYESENRHPIFTVKQIYVNGGLMLSLQIEYWL